MHSVAELEANIFQIFNTITLFIKRLGKLESYLVIYLATYTSLQIHMPVTRCFSMVTGFQSLMDNVNTCSNNRKLF